MNIAYLFRICPNEIQRELMNRTFGCVRFIYNRMLSDKIDHYEKTGKQLMNTPAQYKDDSVLNYDIIIQIETSDDYDIHCFYLSG